MSGLFSLTIAVGRYFFWNPSSAETCWIPPEALLKHLKEAFSATKREMLFDPFCDEDNEDNDDVEKEDAKQPSEQSKPVKSAAEINTEFKDLLLAKEVDPFAPWPSIAAALKDESAFLAVQSDKKRQELLAECCPQLIAIRKAKKEREVAEAQCWFDDQCARLKASGVHWIDALRKLSTDKKRFSLLNVKECEKRYKGK